MASWNLGGQALSKTDRVAADLDILCAQEIPRDKVGWGEDRTDNFVWLSHQSEVQWRGVAIAIAHDLFDCTTDRTSCSHAAAWVVRLRNSRRLVVCSVHLPTGVSVSQYYAAAQACRRMLRGWHEDLPCIVGVDANVELVWNRAETRDGGDDVCLRSGGKVDKFLEFASGCRLQLVAPVMDDRWKPTHYPRDVEREGRHIDCILVRGLGISEVVVDADARLTINTDHAMLRCGVEIQKTRGGRWRDGRPRWVTDATQLFPPRSWDDVKTMAKSHTAPRKSSSFNDDAETKEMIQEARQARGVHAKDLWKRVHAMRRRKRRSWKQARVASILGGNWHAYRQLKREANRRNWWGRLLHGRSSREVGEDVQAHLEGKIFDANLEWGHELSDLVAGVQCRDNDFVPIRAEEIGVALTGMRASSSSGPDQVGVDLLRCLHVNCADELTALFNAVLQSGSLPADWGVSLLALLPKTQWPKDASELRPIAMSSAAFKTMSRVVMQRAFPELRSPGPWSSSGQGRGCADMHGTMSRLRDMVREWRLGVISVKLDIRGAFDRIHRQAVASFLTSRLTCPFELRFLLQVLGENTLEGCAPGGQEVRVRSNRGIRQGSPESAELFGLIISDVINRVKSSGGWRKPSPPLDDMPADVGCYQDDIFVWGECPKKIAHNIGLIAKELAKLGLCLATEKTGVISSSYYKGPRVMDVAGSAVQFRPLGSSLRILGLDFDLDAPAHQQAKEIMGRVWTAFHANKGVLCGVGSRREKAAMVCKLVEGCWSWCAGALHWEKDDLAAMNSMQLRVLRLCFGCKRHAAEDWVSYNSRSLREVRLWLHQNGTERWSTKILRLQFQLMGHWVRRWEGDTPCLPARMQCWRSLGWWHEQQGLSRAAGGVRHPRRFRAANLERSIATCLGVDWRAACNNRAGWKQLLVAWLRAEDVPWCRGRQEAVCA